MPQKLGAVFKTAILEIPSQEAGRRLQQDNWDGRITPRYRKTESCFDKPTKWLKRVIPRESENVFFFKFGLIVSAALKCLFSRNAYKHSLPTSRKVIPIYSPRFNQRYS